jgi:hypothetical protein
MKRKKERIGFHGSLLNNNKTIRPLMIKNNKVNMSEK